MLKSAFKSAVRNLARRPLNGLVIIFSLALAFTFTSLLTGFIYHESETDGFHQKKSRIYKILAEDPFEPGAHIGYILKEVGTYLKQNYPEVEDFCYVSELNTDGVSLQSQDFILTRKMILGVDSSFFKLFDYPYQSSGEGSPLKPYSLILTEETAGQLGRESLHESNTLTLANDTVQIPLSLTGILGNHHQNSHLKFDGLVLFDQLMDQFGGAAYVLLKPESKIQDLIQKIHSDKQIPGLLGPGQSRYYLEPLKDAYFNTQVNSTFIQTRSNLFIKISRIVIILILIVAGINFFNLFLIGLADRQKEFGIRKVLGISGYELIFSTALEILLYILVALVVSICLIYYLIPAFNSSLETNLSLRIFLDHKVLALITGLISLLTLLLLFPLNYKLRQITPLSLFSKATNFKIKWNQWVLGGQSFITVGLIICSVVVIRQFQFMQNAPLGFNRNLLELAPPTPTWKSELGVLKQLILDQTPVTMVSQASGNPISGNWLVRYDLEGDRFYTPYLLSGDFDLLNTLDLQLLDGVAFSPGNTSGKLVNQTLIKKFNLDNPVGQFIPGSRDLILGVVADFRSVSFKDPVQPYIISYEKEADVLLIDYSGLSLGELLPRVKQIWQEQFPGYIFDYKLIDQEIHHQHAKDFYFFKIILAATLASIFISVFGLFALAWAISQTKMKEVGIRKVVGASVFQLIFWISRKFIYWTLLTFLLAAPLAYFLMDLWLQDFSYKIGLNIWTFILAGVICILLSVATISWQTIRSALTNPVNVLKQE
ncbi:MAG: ABC transporter permease [Candidatus Cyclobacteriaceae bacterium M3_2C_046]